MKILRKGVLPKDIKLSMECWNCECLFSAMESEGEKKSDFRNDYYIEFTCPTCEHPVTVSRARVSRAREKRRQ